jgi:hypothetical protein
MRTPSARRCRDEEDFFYLPLSGAVEPQNLACSLPKELEMTKGRRPSVSGHSLDPRLQLVLLFKVLLPGT